VVQTCALPIYRLLDNLNTEFIGAPLFYLTPTTLTAHTSPGAPGYREKGFSRPPNTATYWLAIRDFLQVRDSPAERAWRWRNRWSFRSFPCFYEHTLRGLVFERAKVIRRGGCRRRSCRTSRRTLLCRLGSSNGGHWSAGRQ